MGLELAEEEEREGVSVREGVPDGWSCGGAMYDMACDGVVNEMVCAVATDESRVPHYERDLRQLEEGPPEQEGWSYFLLLVNLPASWRHHLPEQNL